MSERYSHVSLTITREDGETRTVTWDDMIVGIHTAPTHEEDWDAIFSSNVRFLKAPQRADVLVIADDQQHFDELIRHVSRFKP